MVTATLTDGTTTITFDGFTQIDDKVDSRNFTPIIYPEGEGTEVVFETQYYEVWIIKFQFKDDPGYPGSGKSAADKKIDFKTLIKSGGANDNLYTLTFDSEDSTPSSPQLEIYTGKVKIINFRSIAGDNTHVIEGDFEFWEDTIS